MGQLILSLVTQQTKNTVNSPPTNTRNALAEPVLKAVPAPFVIPLPSLPHLQLPYAFQLLLQVRVEFIDNNQSQYCPDSSPKQVLHLPLKI